MKYNKNIDTKYKYKIFKFQQNSFRISKYAICIPYTKQLLNYFPFSKTYEIKFCQTVVRHFYFGYAFAESIDDGLFFILAGSLIIRWLSLLIFIFATALYEKQTNFVSLLIFMVHLNKGLILHTSKCYLWIFLIFATFDITILNVEYTKYLRNQKKSQYFYNTLLINIELLGQTKDYH